MDYEDKIEQARELIRKRDAIDEQLIGLFGGETTKKERVCGICKMPGHNARACPQAERPNGATIS